MARIKKIFVKQFRLCEDCDLIYQAPNNSRYCHLETPHRILQDNLLDGGDKERVEEMSKLAG